MRLHMHVRACSYSLVCAFVRHVFVCATHLRAPVCACISAFFQSNFIRCLVALMESLSRSQ